MEPTAAASSQDTHRTKSRHRDPKYGQGCKTAIVWTFLFILAASLLSPLTLVLVSAHSTLSVFSCSLLLFTVHFFGWLSPTCTPSPPLLPASSLLRLHLTFHTHVLCLPSTDFLFFFSPEHTSTSPSFLWTALITHHSAIYKHQSSQKHLLKLCVNLSIPVVIQPPP